MYIYIKKFYVIIFEQKKEGEIFGPIWPTRGVLQMAQNSCFEAKRWRVTKALGNREFEW